MRIRAYGKHLFVLKIAKEIKTSRVYIPEVYDREDIIEGHVVSTGSRVRIFDIHPGDNVLFRVDMIKGIMSYDHTVAYFLCADDVLATRPKNRVLRYER